jgi:hypothetical protein
VRLADGVKTRVSSIAVLGSESEKDGGFGERLYALEIFCLAIET